MQERPAYVENVLQRLAELQRWLGGLNPGQRAELSVDIDRLIEDLRLLFSSADESPDASSHSPSEPARAVAPDISLAATATAQQKLLEGDEMFRSLATNVDLVLWIRAHDSNQIIYVSPAYETIWGQTRESLYRAPNLFTDAIHPDDRDRVVGEMAALGKGGFSGDYRIVTPNGLTRWIHARTFAVSGRNRAQARVAGVAQDITEQKETEATLRITLTRMRERYIYSSLLAAARTAEDVVNAVRSLAPLHQASRLTVLVFDEPWASVPPTSCETLVDWRGAGGLPTETAQSQLIANHPLAHLFERDRAVLIDDVLTEPRLTEDARSWLAQINSRSLLLFPFVTTNQWYGMLNAHYPDPQHMEPQDLEYYEKVVNQAAVAIYNFRLLESETLARQEAERANEVKLRFLAMITHELRTPLTSIKGFATTLLADDVTWDATSQRDFLETINEEADKLTELIEQLLDLSRLEAGTLRIVLEEKPLNAIVDASLPQLRALTSDHLLVVTIPDGLPPVLADSQRVGQVLANLVNNASKFSPSATRITISAAHKGKHVQVSVRDQGPGITPDERARVFESFYQTKTEGSKRRARGVGLGLAICRGLIEAHGGRIWVHDRPGPGTIISFTLPTAEASDPTSG